MYLRHLINLAQTGLRGTQHRKIPIHISNKSQTLLRHFLAQSDCLRTPVSGLEIWRNTHKTGSNAWKIPRFALSRSYDVQPINTPHT